MAAVFCPLVSWYYLPLMIGWWEKLHAVCCRILFRFGSKSKGMHQFVYVITLSAAALPLSPSGTFSLSCPLCSVGLVLRSVELWNGFESPLVAPGLEVSQRWAQGQYKMLQAHTKSAAEFIAYLWEPRKGRLMLVPPYNGAGGVSMGLTYISG